MDKKIVDKMARDLVTEVRAGRYATADELDAGLIEIMRRHGLSWWTKAEQLDLLRHAPVSCIREAEEYACGLAQIAREATAIRILKIVRGQGIDPENP